MVEKRVREEGRDVRKQLGVDFVAKKKHRPHLYPISAGERMSEKAAQEKASLFGINDSFKKAVLVRSEHGVATISVFDFLHDENSHAGI